MRYSSSLLVAASLGCGRVAFAPLASDAGGDAIDALPIDIGGDSSVTVDPCDSQVTGDLVALYTFDAGLAADATGQHDGAVRGTVSASSTGRCGTAGAFSIGHLLVPGGGFELATGAIDLFARVPTPAFASNQTLLSRDANGFESEGHLVLILNTAGVLLVRLQRGGVSYYRCGPQVPAQTWFHVGVSFGGTAGQGLRMWLDGVEATEAASMIDGQPLDCTGTPPAGGLTGNGNMLVIGANNSTEPEGDPDPMPTQYLFGDLDHVRFRSTWIDFGAP